MDLRIDYHFHPNLPADEKKALTRCRAHWQAFLSHGINVVIITEHVFKDFERAYRLMNQTKPPQVFCLPGIEYATRESSDLIIFSYSDTIYTHPEFSPFALKYEEAVDLIEQQPAWRSFVPHPYTPDVTSVRNTRGDQFYRHIVNRLGAVEISNSSFLFMERILVRFPWRYIGGKFLRRIVKIKSLPLDEYPDKIKFLAVGSDAHHPWQIGSHLLINNFEEDPTLQNIWQAISSRTGITQIAKPVRVIPHFFQFIHTVVQESKMRRRKQGSKEDFSRQASPVS
jgi:hypothetical protein